MKALFNLTSPKPFESVGSTFSISGWIDKSCLKTEWGIYDSRILGCFVDLEGCEFACTISADARINLFSFFRKSYFFHTTASFSTLNVPFIEASKGRIALKLTAPDGSSIYQPIIVDHFKTEEDNPEIAHRHKSIESLIKKYELDLQNYNKEMENIRVGSLFKTNVTENDTWMTDVDIEDDEILQAIIESLSDSQEEYEMQYALARQAQAEKNLKKKYAAALNWRGPLLRGRVDTWKGFVILAHSHDHGKHLHITHPGKNIDARLKWPEMTIESYVSKKQLRSKELKAIRERLTLPKMFAKAEAEFNRRPS